MGKIGVFLPAHFGLLLRRRVVEADQVQGAVNHVQQQFVLGLPAVPRGGQRGRLRTDDDFPFQPIVAALEDETQHVGRFVNTEILLVQSGDGGIVDQRDADFGVGNRGFAKDGAHGLLQSALVRCDVRLPVGDFDGNHQAVFWSGYLIRP